MSTKKEELTTMPSNTNASMLNANVRRIRSSLYTLDNNTFAKNKVLSENSITDTVKIAKIKEYAKLISRTPLEKISEIF